jgi:hypothetical protein
MISTIRRRPRTFVLAAGLIVTGVIAYVVFPSDEGAEPGREGSRIVDARVVVASRSLQRYAISYVVETHTDAGTTSVREDTLVRRPFDARVVARASSGATETLSAFGRYAIRGQVSYVPPGPPSADLRPDAVVADAVEDGYAEVRETREVIGRPCRVHRFGDGAEAGALAPLEEADTYTDVCVDAKGLVLEEVTFDGRDIVRRRIAEEIDERPRIDRERFDLPEPEEDPQKIGSVKELAEDSRLPGGRFWQLTDAPKGFEPMGRYAVVPPAQPGFTDITARGNVISFLSMVYTNGSDVLVIDQGATQGAAPFAPDPHARRVRAGDLGRGELRYSLRESEVRFLTGGVRFVTVRGTLPPSRLLAIARSLEAVEGGPLRVKEDG